MTPTLLNPQTTIYQRPGGESRLREYLGQAVERTAEHFRNRP